MKCFSLRAQDVRLVPKKVGEVQKTHFETSYEHFTPLEKLYYQFRF